MKKLLILATLMILGVTHAHLVEIQTMASPVVLRHRNTSAYQLVEENQRPDSDSERRARSAGRTEVTGEHVAARSRGEATVSPTQEVDDCPCGPDCKCPDPMVCKNGDCKKNYVVFLSAEWCRPCQRMYPRITELREAGYIVYVFDVDKFPKASEKFAVKSLPTTVVMDQGKETHRFVGVVAVEKITSVTKPRDQQPESCDYNFL